MEIGIIAYLQRIRNIQVLTHGAFEGCIATVQIGTKIVQRTDETQGTNIIGRTNACRGTCQGVIEGTRTCIRGRTQPNHGGGEFNGVNKGTNVRFHSFRRTNQLTRADIIESTDGGR